MVYEHPETYSGFTRSGRPRPFIASTDHERAQVALAGDEHRAIWLGRAHPDDPTGASGSESAPLAELLASHLGVVVLNVGPSAGAAQAVELIDDPRPHVRTWARIVLAYSLARTGRCQQALEVAASGPDSHSPVEWFATWDRWWHGFNRCEALLHAGRLDEARRLALASYEHAFVQTWTEEQAFFGWQLSRISFDAGQLTTAARYGRISAALFRDLGRAAYVRAAQISVVLAEIRSVHPAEAESELAELAWPDDAVPSMLRADYRRAEAAIAVTKGALAHARTLLSDGAEQAAACGDLAGESAALHDLVRLGPGPEVAGRLSELAAASDSELVAVRCAHAHAALADDPGELEAVANRFAELGHNLSAAGAAAEAAARWCAQGRARRGAAAQRRSRDLAQACEDAAGLESLTVRGTLTPAEHQTAALAVAGHTNREIARDLLLSQSTVENRLQRIYHKLGISGRGELTEIFQS